MREVTALPRPTGAVFARASVAEYLAVLWPHRSRRVIDDLFAHGRIRSGGRPVSPRSICGSLGDLELVGAASELPVMFDPPAAESQPPAADAIEFGLRIVHEDERLVAVAKPEGLPVVPDRTGGPESVLAALTRRELAARRERSPAEMIRFRVVHRLDRWTSGIVLLAKSLAAERRLASDFEHRRVRKVYAAVLAGRVAAARITVRVPIGPGRKGKMRPRTVAHGGKDAQTTFDVVERWTEATLVRAYPRTGRQHQIRVHARSIEHPLAVDPLYSPASRTTELAECSHLTLHAERYTLSPDWTEPRDFRAPWPASFKAVVDRLREGNHSSRRSGSGSAGRDLEK